MLKSLTIKNLALIEDASLEFSEGLNVLTGETGAGKTIVLEALGLLLGDRSRGELVRQGATRLSVTGTFQASPRLKRVLSEGGLDAAEEVLVRREVDAQGKSKSFVNDEPVSVGTLARIGDLLVQTHGQHEHQVLVKAAEQRDLVDAFGGLEKEREIARGAFAAWTVVSEEKAALALSEQERAQRIDLYKFQKDELAAVDPKPGEDEELELRLPILKNAEKLRAAGSEAQSLLSAGDTDALGGLRRALKGLEAMTSLGADLGEASDFLRQAVVNGEEAAARLDATLDKIELDPNALDQTLGRMDKLARMKKKYGPALEDVIAARARIEAELDRLENLEGKSLDVERRLAEAGKILSSACAALTAGRKAAAKKMSAAVEKEFKEVGLPHAALEIAVLPLDGGPAAHGADDIRFLFAPNPGEGKNPLADIASGGELSRVMLAIKSVQARTDAAPVLVFDEIDAGVGGAVGGVLGKKLAKLGKTSQVFCVTHLATIAACASAHFAVEKEIGQGRTRTTIRSLSPEERVAEIARMFGTAEGGEKEAAAGLKHARELLAASRL
jgi:DNA repair protein RecN (Recombination protein N)